MLDTCGPVFADPSLSSTEQLLRLRDANVIWVNTEELHCLGVDYHAVKTQFDDWLLKEFAFRIASEGEVADRQMFADRYGSTPVSPFGGSGRAVNYNGFNIKGVGRTGLVSPTADYQHSSGFLWLSEAIRDVVASKILRIELPNGCQPIIAIIEFGQPVWRSDKEWFERPALIVRSSFLRPAHLERAIVHGSSNTNPGDQARDIDRVQRHFRNLQEHSSPQSPVSSVIASCASLAAESRVNHLWCGRFSSDNVDLDGLLCDFGAFSAVPHWGSWQTKRGEAFDLISDVESMARSLAFHGSRFCNLATLSIEEAIDLAHESYRSGARSALSRRFRLDLLPSDASKDLLERIERYYHSKMCTPVSRTGYELNDQARGTATATHWQLAHGQFSENHVPSDCCEIINIITTSKPPLLDADMWARWLNFIVYSLQPRSNYLESRLEHKVREFVGQEGDGVSEEGCRKFISLSVSEALRGLSAYHSAKIIPEAVVMSGDRCFLIGSSTSGNRLVARLANSALRLDKSGSCALEQECFGSAPLTEVATILAEKHQGFITTI